MHIQAVVVGVNKQRFSVDLSLKPSHLRYAQTLRHAYTYIHTHAHMHAHTDACRRTHRQIHTCLCAHIQGVVAFSVTLRLNLPYPPSSSTISSFSPSYKLHSPIEQLKITDQYLLSLHTTFTHLQNN